ncbi:MAG: formylglycine-generating enzyme family protein [Sandaracinaceae bacterium]|nr:formylglycine-generating enzyme family protein [Sandaracinaceae bacterium]
MRILRVTLLVVPLSVGFARPSASKPAPLHCPPQAVAIPAGTFPIGTTRSQDFDVDEQPRRMVTLTRAYCLDRTEVTVGEWETCVRAGACPERKPFFAGDKLPMTNVDWHDARRACSFRGGRLPTEVEWEHAARGGDDRLFPWGSWRPDCPYADLWGETWGSCGTYGPSAVGSSPKGASPFGALDMAGNVLEWVDDAFDGKPWSALPDVDPHHADPKARLRGVRGGSWDYDVVHSLRVSDRDGYPSDLRDATLGFRCAYDPLP